MYFNHSNISLNYIIIILLQSYNFRKKFKIVQSCTEFLRVLDPWQNGNGKF